MRDKTCMPEASQGAQCQEFKCVCIRFFLMKADHLESKFVGALVGSALGDAIGELAFSHPQKELLVSTVKHVRELRYTDDTAMAIALAESLIRDVGVDQEKLGLRFSETFYREPWRGYASGPPTIFSMVNRTGISFVEASRTLFRGMGSLGNGAAMRIAPLGLFSYDSPDLYDQACASAEVTHAHPVGMDGGAVQAYAVAQAVSQDPKKAFPAETFLENLLRSSRTGEIKEKLVLVQRLIEEKASPSLASGMLGRTVAVHESMPFALYSFLSYPGAFEECLYCAVLHGGDRDTLGAMACAISGAYLGVEAIPEAWREKLENGEYIASLALKLAEACFSPRRTKLRKGDLRTPDVA
jgi:poly(ADP-ribose) glycohydrolase ARH3